MHSSAELLAIVESMDRKGAISNNNLHYLTHHTYSDCDDDIPLCSKTENGCNHSFPVTTRYSASQEKAFIVEGPPR